MFKAIVSVFLCLLVTVFIYLSVQVKLLNNSIKKLKYDITFLENHQIDVDVFCKSVFKLTTTLQDSVMAMTNALDATGLFQRDFKRGIYPPRSPSPFLVAKKGKKDESIIN